MKRGNTLNMLMKHLRDDHGMKDLYGSSRKIRLRNMGHFHGYKGYRYIRRPDAKLELRSFADLEYVYHFDARVKSAFYPQIMYIETALKNIILARIVENLQDPSLSSFLKNGLNDCKLPNGTINKTAMLNKLQLKTTLIGIVKNRYSDSHVKHYVDRDDDAPLWSIFESMTLGNLYKLCQSLPPQTTQVILKDIGFDGSNLELLASIIETLRPLRNAIAHNLVVFDARFSPHAKLEKQNKHLHITGALLKNELGLSYEPRFDTLIDYISLVTIIGFKVSQRTTPARSFLRDCRNLLRDLQEEIGTDRYIRIVGTGDRQKLVATERYLMSR